MGGREGAVGCAPGSLRAWLWLAEAFCTGDASISGPTLARARVGRRPSAILISISGLFARFLVTHRCGGYRRGQRPKGHRICASYTYPVPISKNLVMNPQS